MRIVLSFLMVLSVCGCKTESKVEKVPEPAPTPAAEEKPIITDETKAADASVKEEVESICQTLRNCRIAAAEGGKCDATGVMKELALKTPYATGLRDRLVSSDMAKKSLDELTQNAQGLGAKCELDK